MNCTSEYKRFAALIEYAKELPVYPSVEWDTPVWDITPYQKQKGHKNKRWKLKFLQRCGERISLDKRAPFASSFSELCKCFIKIKQQKKNVTFDPHQRTLDSLGVLYEILYRSDPECEPTGLTKRHFVGTEEILLNEYKATTAYRMAKALQEVAVFMDKHRLTSLKLAYKSSIKKPEVGDLRDQKGQDEGMKKIPSEEIFEVLAEISNAPLDEGELIRARIIDLLIVGGFRIGEVLCLPVKCWVEKPQYAKSGKPLFDEYTGGHKAFCGIRYWPEKGADPSIKWIPTHSVPLAKRAIDDLTKHCEKARLRAKVLERDTDRVVISSKVKSDEVVTAKQLGELVGVKHGGDFLRQLKVAPINYFGTRKGGAFLYRIGDVEKALVKRRKPLTVVERSGGKVQTLSESLCVCLFDQFSSTKVSFEFLAEPINEQHISDMLGGRRHAKSSFDRRGIKAPDGSPLCVNTHAFRHWLNTLADHGGLNELQLARWMGRKDVKQNEAYKHATVAQRVTMAKKLIKNGGLAGPIADVYEGLDPVDREHFLEAQVNTAHFTPFGLCVHDFSIEPCEYHLKCLDGCLEYLRRKGDERERRELKKLECVLEKQIARHRGEVCKIDDHNDPFLQYSLRQLDGVRAALAVDDNYEAEECDDSTLIKVFSEGETQGGRSGS